MNMLQKLSIKFVERATALNLKGKARDNECLSFFVGAHAAMEMADHPEAEYVKTCGALIICIRGYGEVARIAKNAQDAEKETKAA
jgi:hypothetical protein